MQGGQNFIRSHVANKDRGGSHATKADNAVANIIEATGNYNGAANNDFKYDKVVKYNLETVSSELVKMSPDARKNYLDSIGVYKNAFDRETGKMKENSMPYAHREAITANLRTFSGNLSHKPLKGTESITNGAKTAKKTVERVVGSGAAVVVTNELGADDRAIYNPDDGVIYINNNADLTEKDVAKAVALHEITHTTEGTKAYRKLVKQIEAIANDTNVPESVKKIIGDIALRKFSTANSCEAEMEGFSKEQSRYLVDTEVSADLIGDLLSDDYFIEKLAERDMGLLEKLYHSFKNRANAKKSELGPDGIKYLKKLASKFGTAIEKRAGGVKISQIGDEDEKKEEKPQEAVISNERASLTPTKAENLKLVLIQLGKKRIVKNAGGKKITILTDEFTANKAIFSSKGRSKKEVNARIKAIPKFEQIIRDSEYVESDTVITGIEKSAKKGVIAMHKFKGTYENYDIEILVRDKGKRQFLYEIKFKENKKSPQQSMTDKSASTAPLGDVENDTRISQKKQSVNSSDERSSKNRSYDPKNDNEPTFEEVPGGVKVDFHLFDDAPHAREQAAEQTRKESLDALPEDGGTTFVGLTNADLDEYVATGKTLHTRNKKQRMLENGKSPILTTESEIAEFVTKAIHGEALGEVRAFGKVDERLAQAINNVRISLNLEGKYLEIQADAIREAYKVHSAPKEKGDIVLTEEDFKNIHRHIFDFDGVLSVDTHNGKTEIHMYKKSEGGYYHILTVVSSERSSLQVTKLIGVSKEKLESKYAKKIERSTGSLRMQEASDPSTKAQHTASVLSNNSIHKSGEKSNSFDKKTQKNHYNSKKTVRELVEGAIATLDLTDEEGKAFAFVTKDAERDVVSAFWKAVNSAYGNLKNASASRHSHFFISP